MSTPSFDIPKECKTSVVVDEGPNFHVEVKKVPVPEIGIPPACMTPIELKGFFTLPVHFPKANITVSNRIQSQKSSPHHKVHQTRIELELRSPSPRPTSRDIGGNGADEAKSDEDAFWMGRSQKRLHDEPKLRSHNNKPFPSISHHRHASDPSHPVPVALSWLPGAVYQDSDDLDSVTSRSTFSEESVPSTTADRPLILPHTVDEESLFQSLFRELDEAFQEFEGRIDQRNGPLPVEDMVLKLPVFHAPRVMYGLRPDQTSCWKGFVYLNGRHSILSKLLKSSFENRFIYGVEIGGVEDVSGYGDAVLFMGQDRKVYYTSSNGWFEEDKDGFYEYQVHGGFELRECSMSRMLEL